MSVNLEAKKEIVNKMVDEFKNAKSIIFVDFKGLKVSEDTELRKEFRTENISYKVYKNRLIVRALEQLGINDYDKTMLEGTTAVAFGTDEIAPARIFVSNSEKFKKMNVKFGIVNNLILDKIQVEQLAKIPSKPALISMLLYVLNGPMSAMARALSEISKKEI